jgi:glycosyltransferase involved in cell wall biosynthesis
MSQAVVYLHNSSSVSGGERSLLGLWSALDRTRYRPVLLLPEEGLLADEARQSGVSVYFLKVPAWKWGNIPALFRALGSLRDIIRAQKVRLIHSYTPRNNMLSVVAARISGIGVIWHERNIPVNGEADLSRRFSFLPDGIICNSGAVARRFGTSSKTRVIHNGVDEEYFSCGLDLPEAKRALGLAARKVVGVVANFSLRKGLDVFLGVAALVARQDTRVSFLVVGGAYGPDCTGRESGLKAAAEKLGLSGKVVWAGFQADVRPYLAAMDVLCHPTEQEACSRAVLEAMALGKAVVVFNDGGNPELVRQGETGICVAPGQFEDMADSVVQLLRNEDCARRFGVCARARVMADFTLRRNAQQTMEFYKSICG